MSKTIYVIIIVFLICLINTNVLAKQSTSNSIVVMIDKGRSGFVITVDSKRPSVSLLLTLSQLKMSDTNAKRNVVLLAHEDISLSMLTNIINIINKAGYVEPRVLFFDHHKDWMAEIVISGGIPFSKTPSWKP